MESRNSKRCGANSISTSRGVGRTARRRAWGAGARRAWRTAAATAAAAVRDWAAQCRCMVASRCFRLVLSVGDGQDRPQPHPVRLCGDWVMNDASAPAPVSFASHRVLFAGSCGFVQRGGQVAAPHAVAAAGSRAVSAPPAPEVAASLFPLVGQPLVLAGWCLPLVVGRTGAVGGSGEWRVGSGLRFGYRKVQFGRLVPPVDDKLELVCR